MKKGTTGNKLMDKLLDKCSFRTWTSLEKVHSDAVVSVTLLGNTMTNIYRIAARGSKSSMAKKLFEVAVFDFEEAMKDIEGIQNQWKHKSGLARDAAEEAEMDRIYENYMRLTATFTALASQHSLELTILAKEVEAQEQAHFTTRVAEYEAEEKAKASAAVENSENAEGDAPVPVDQQDVDVQETPVAVATE